MTPDPEQTRAEDDDIAYLGAWITNLDRSLSQLRRGSLGYEDTETDRDCLIRVRDRLRESAPPTDPEQTRVELAREAIRETLKALLVVKPELDKPYPTDPRWSPWSRWVDRHERTPWKLLQRADEALREPAPDTEGEARVDRCPDCKSDSRTVRKTISLTGPVTRCCHEWHDVRDLRSRIEEIVAFMERQASAAWLRDGSTKQFPAHAIADSLRSALSLSKVPASPEQTRVERRGK